MLVVAEFAVRLEYVMYSVESKHLSNKKIDGPLFLSEFSLYGHLGNVLSNDVFFLLLQPILPPSSVNITSTCVGSVSEREPLILVS